MKVITSEVKALLDKLYNLRGEDSIILKKMNKEREDAIETQERTKNEKEVLLGEIERLTNEEQILAEQGNKLMDVLSNINRDEFAFVLDELKIDFEPDMINEKVSKLLPETIDKVVSENKTAKEKLENVEKEMNNAITLVEELGIRKDEAISNQAKLNEYFELALNGNINITRDEIVSLLEKFDFNVDEQREAAKLLMFPEDALFEYNANLNGQSKAKTDEEIIAEVNEEEPLEIVDDFVEESPEATEETVVTPVAENKDEAKVEPVKEENKETAKGMLERILEENGLNPRQFSDRAFAKILENYSEELIHKNVEILKKKNMNLDIVFENFELLYDKELGEKVDKLLEIGKEVNDICLMPSVLIKYDLNGLNNTINILQISGLDPKKVPLMAY